MVLFTDRDMEIFRFMSRYGKTYIEVLGDTFFGSEQQARNRVNKIKKENFITYVELNIKKPSRAIIFTAKGKKHIYSIDDKVCVKKSSARINTSTIEHNVLEQKTDYYLSQIGFVERATVYSHYSKMYHVPDLIFYNKDNKKIHIEVELNIKSRNRYKSIIASMSNDEMHAVVYIVQSKEKLTTLAKALPKWSKIFLIDYESLKNNILNDFKMRPYKQADLI